MISWEEYLTETVTTYRKEFRRLSYRSQTLVSEIAFHSSLLEPCQIEVFDSGVEKSTVLLVAHDNNLPDMTFRIHENVENLDASEFIKSYEFIHEKELIEKNLAYPSRHHYVYMKDLMVALERDGPLHLAMSLFFLLEDMVKTEQVDVIERSTDGLKKSIEKVSEKDIRDELLATTKRINASLQEIRRLDEEIGEVRKLVGVTKEIQDWRLLFTDVDRLKDEHVPKQVFDAKLERLDEKIEKGLENLSKRVDDGIKALNTRIEDLKAIKFWSKRTLLEIALAILAIISTLFATGTLEF